MKKLLFILITFSFSSFTYAGHKKGNGGSVIECTTNGYKDITTLDLYELKNRYHFSIKRAANINDEIVLANLFIERIKSISPNKYQFYKKHISSFYTDSIFTYDSLGEIEDVGYVEIPLNCELKQAVNRNRNVFPHNKLYLINQNIWNILSPIEKASLIIHEVVYLNLESNTSEPVRKFVSYMIADMFNLFTKSEYTTFLKDIGFIYHTVDNLIFFLPKDFNFYHNQKIKNVYPKINSTYIWKGNYVKLQKRVIDFFKNGQASSMCSANKINIDTVNGNLSHICLNDDAKLLFFNNGNIKTISPLEGSLNFVNYSITSKSFDDRGRLSFSKEGLVTEANNVLISLLDNNNRTVRLKGKTFFTKNGDVLKSKILEVFSYKHNSFKVFLRGEVEFYKTRQIKSATPERNFYFKYNEQNLLISANFKVTFHPTGELMSGVVMKAQTVKLINGDYINLKKLQRIEINNNQIIKVQ